MKIQEDSFDQSPQSFSKQNSKNAQQISKNNRKYNKITHDLRMKFLDKIFFENKSIKKAAQELNINYSSAKTILNLHRKKQRFQQQPLVSQSDISSESDSLKMCGFSTNKKQNLELVITLGGRTMNSNKVESTTTSNSQSSEKIALPQSNVASSVNLFNQSTHSLNHEEIYLQQQQQQANQQHQQLLLKYLQEQQIQEQQRLQQQQLQQLAMNPEFYSLLLEKQRQDQQQQFVLSQLLQQQQQKNQSFGLF